MKALAKMALVTVALAGVLWAAEAQAGGFVFWGSRPTVVVRTEPVIVQRQVVVQQPVYVQPAPVVIQRPVYVQQPVVTRVVTPIYTPAYVTYPYYARPYPTFVPRFDHRGHGRPYFGHGGHDGGFGLSIRW
jgi:hypothetical protein